MSCRCNATLTFRRSTNFIRYALRRHRTFISRIGSNYFGSRFVQRRGENRGIDVSISRCRARFVTFFDSGCVTGVENFHRIMRKGMSKVIRIAMLIRVTRASLCESFILRLRFYIRDGTFGFSPGMRLFFVGLLSVIRCFLLLSIEVVYEWVVLCGVRRGFGGRALYMRTK